MNTTIWSVTPAYENLVFFLASRKLDFGVVIFIELHDFDSTKRSSIVQLIDFVRK